MGQAGQADKNKLGIFIPSEIRDVILGDKYVRIKRWQEKLGMDVCRLHDDGVLFLLGTRAAIENIQADVEEEIRKYDAERRETTAGEQSAAVISVPPVAIGHLIGKHHVRINAMKYTPGLTYELDDTNGLLTLRGCVEAVEFAERDAYVVINMATTRLENESRSHHSNSLTRGGRLLTVREIHHTGEAAPRFSNDLPANRSQNRRAERERSLHRSLLALALAVACAVSSAAEITAHPPRGFNAWFAWDVSLNESHMMAAADGLVRLGLRDKNYSFVNLDGGWQGGRFKNGSIFENATRFPSGMRALADYVHARGLLFGAYTDRGSSTCDGRTGSRGHEALDAQTFAGWGADFLKSDSCGGDMSHRGAVAQYQTMAAAIAATGREMFYSLCGWLSWYPIAASPAYRVGDSWRIGPDALSWPNVLYNIDAAVSATSFVGLGAWPDVDEVMGPSRGRPISRAQTRTQLCFIALVGSPLLLSFELGDIAGPDDPDIADFLNDEILAVHWDNAAPAPGRPPLFDRVQGGSLAPDKQPPRTRLPCDDAAAQWRWLPTSPDGLTGYLASQNAPGQCLQAGPSWAFMFNNAQAVWLGACGGTMCGDAACLNQQWRFDNASGLVTSLYWPENNIAAGPFLSLDAVRDALFLNERFNGSSAEPLNDAGTQLWALDAARGQLRSAADGSCVGAAPRDSANVWAKQLAGGAVALLLINTAPAAQAVACDAGCLARAGFADAGATLSVRDIVARTDNGTVTVGEGFTAMVAADGGSVFVRLALSG